MKWQQIETAPKDGTAVLVWIGADGNSPGFAQNASYREGYWWDMADYGYSELVTHWQPLPSPPQSPSSDEERSDEVSAADKIASLTHKIEAQAAIISDKNDLIEKLEADRAFMIVELGRLMKRLGMKDLSE